MQTSEYRHYVVCFCGQIRDMCYRPHLARFLYDTGMCLVVQCYDKIWATLIGEK